jgi:hypothetical protein
MLTPRDGPAAVRLLDGRVLVVGGSGDEFDPSTAELYDPPSGTWSATGSMLAPSDGLPPTLLLDGRVLVGDQVDGHYGNGDFYGYELYDPATGTWTATGRMAGDVPGDTPTVLRDGRVLALSQGGAQVYDPASGTWTVTRKMNDQGYETAAALLPDGKVLLAGGRGYGGGLAYYFLKSAQVYDPAPGSWTAIANMHEETRTSAAFLQPDGKVLVLGSAYGDSFHAEVYDPAGGTWTERAVRPGLRYQAATPLSDGTVLVAFVTDAEQPACGAELYDPRTASWTTAASMLRCGGSLTLLLASSSKPPAQGTIPASLFACLRCRRIHGMAFTTDMRCRSRRAAMSGTAPGRCTRSQKSSREHRNRPASGTRWIFSSTDR